MEINNYDLIADLYDVYVPATYDIDFFTSEAGKLSGDVLELMSGTGRVSIPLIKAGVKLTCLDSSAALNTILKNKLEQKHSYETHSHRSGKLGPLKASRASLLKKKGDFSLLKSPLYFMVM